MTTTSKPDDKTRPENEGTSTAAPIKEALPAFDLTGKKQSPDFATFASDDAAIADTVAAMANLRTGGTIVIGVKATNGTLKAEGVSDSDTAQDHALKALLSVSPRIIAPMPRAMSVADKTVVVIEIPAGLPQVYSIDGRFLQREGTNNVPLTPRELRRLFIERGEIVYETEPAHNGSAQPLTRDDIDWSKVQAYAARMGETDITELLIKRGCAIRDGDTIRPTNAGILLFGKDTRRYLRGAEITAVRFAGENMGDTFNRQDISGTLPEQIRMAETFLRDHLRKGVELKDTMAREERYEYPLEAARELVVNAVAHRDYSIQGDGIRLYLFKDRMEIMSPGLLPGPVTIANIKDERFSRNPAIVQVLADMGYIERLGYGVDRVIELMRQQDLREPEFIETGGGFKVVLYNTNASPEASDQPDNGTTPKAVTTPAPATVASAIPVTPVAHTATPTPATILENYRDIALNARQETALLYLDEAGNTRITNSELQKMHPDVHAETIRRDLSDLVSKNILVKMGEKRGSYYVLKREDE